MVFTISMLFVMAETGEKNGMIRTLTGCARYIYVYCVSRTRGYVRRAIQIQLVGSPQVREGGVLKRSAYNTCHQEFLAFDGAKRSISLAVVLNTARPECKNVQSRDYRWGSVRKYET